MSLSHGANPRQPRQLTEGIGARLAVFELMLGGLWGVLGAFQGSLVGLL